MGGGPPADFGIAGKPGKLGMLGIPGMLPGFGGGNEGAPPFGAGGIDGSGGIPE